MAPFGSREYSHLILAYWKLESLPAFSSMWQTVGRSDGQTESIMANTALCIASYADAR